MRAIFPICAIYLFGLTCVPFRAACAEETAESRPVFPRTWKTADEAVKLGVIAEEVVTPGDAEIAVGTLGAAPGDKVNPIIGGIQRVDEDTCVAMVRNRGRLPYSVGYSFVGVEKDGREVFDRYFSAELKPEAEATQQIDGCDVELNLAIVLRSARKRGE